MAGRTDMNSCNNCCAETENEAFALCDECGEPNDAAILESPVFKKLEEAVTKLREAWDLDETGQVDGEFIADLEAALEKFKESRT